MSDLYKSLPIAEMASSEYLFLLTKKQKWPKMVETLIFGRDLPGDASPEP